MGQSVGRSVGRWVGQSFGRSFGRSVGQSIERVPDEFIESIKPSQATVDVVVMDGRVEEGDKVEGRKEVKVCDT